VVGVRKKIRTVALFFHEISLTTLMLFYGLLSRHRVQWSVSPSFGLCLSTCKFAGCRETERASRIDLLSLVGVTVGSEPIQVEAVQDFGRVGANLDFQTTGCKAETVLPSMLCPQLCQRSVSVCPSNKGREITSCMWFDPQRRCCENRVSRNAGRS